MNYVEDVCQQLMDHNDEIDHAHATVYAILVLTKGVNTTLSDLHDAWSALKNTVRPDHKYLVPFEELSSEVQELDRMYLDSVHHVAKVLYG